MSGIKYKYGIASFVELSKFKAKKHMALNEMYWAKEYTTLLYLWKYKHSNIIRYESGSYLDRTNPKSDIKQRYYELTFPRLHKTLNEASIYDDKSVIQVMIDLLSAIALCHKLHIMHRDIKKANILYDSGRATLIDFTHALRVRTENIKLDEQVATYSHRAPEVFKYQRKKVAGYTDKIDIWAIGIILFELVIDSSLYTHLTPEHTEAETDDFFNKTIPKIYMDHLKAIYVKKKRTMFHSRVYWSWIKKMLSYFPDHRPTAQEMLEIITKFADDNDIEYITPTCRDIDSFHSPPPPITTDEQRDLHMKVMALVTNYHSIYCINFDVTIMADVYSILIVSKTLTEKNHVNVTLAAYLLVCAVIYDCIVDLPDAIELFDTNGIKFQVSAIQSAMIHVMQNNEIDLFLHVRIQF